MHGRNSEIGLSHLFRQPVDLALGIAEDDGLCDGKCIVEIAKCVKFPLFSFNGNEELLDSFQRQFVTVKQEN